METVVSADGTQIGFDRVGSGPPLVLVHGTAGSRGRWGAVLDHLAAGFEVVDIDRRGRGASGDAEDYALAREVEDILAIIDSLDAPVNLLGHSFGGIVALETALLTDKLARLILYEPPVAAPNTAESQAHNRRLAELAAADDADGVLTTFLRDSVGVPEPAIDQMRQSPSWPHRLATAQTLPREHRAVIEYTVQPERFVEMSTPTLLLLGGASPPVFVESTRAVDAALPDSRVVELPGQQHAAMDTAPELFVQEVLAFLQP